MAGHALKRGPLWRVTIRTGADGEELASAGLTELLGAGVSVYVDADTGAVEVSGFAAKLPPGWRAGAQTLAAQLRGMAREGLKTGPGQVSVRRLGAREWLESWKRHFQPIRIPGRLLVKPSWSGRRAARGRRWWCWIRA